jgi:aryl-alcohol dehydrogenase-like predicted oxidoreductase
LKTFISAGFFQTLNIGPPPSLARGEYDLFKLLQTLSNLELMPSVPVAFGCMSLSGDETATIRLLRRAHDGGITLFDTADLYDRGENEKLVGKAFRGMRDRVLLASKVGNQWRADGSGWDWNPRKDYILKSIDGTLRRLQTDYLDLYQLHGGTLDDPIDETIEAFELLQQQGKIRAYGISSIRPTVIREWVRRSNLRTVMMQYSLLDRRPEETVLPLLQEKGIGVLARGSLAKGLLIDKPAAPFLDYSKASVQKAAEALRSLPDRRPTEVAVQFALYPPAVQSAVVGIRTEAQLDAALQAAAAPPLRPDEYERLSGVLTPNRYEEHR